MMRLSYDQDDAISCFHTEIMLAVVGKSFDSDAFVFKYLFRDIVHWTFANVGTKYCEYIDYS